MNSSHGPTDGGFSTARPQELNRIGCYSVIMTKEYGKLNLNIDKAIHRAFRDYVYEKYGSTYKSGAVIEEFIKESLEKRGIVI